MKIKVPLIFLWSLVVVIAYLVFVTVRPEPLFLSSQEFSFELKPGFQWVWSMPSFFDIRDLRLIEYFDGLVVYLLALSVLLLGWIFIWPGSKLLGFRGKPGSWRWLLGMGLVMGILGLILIQFTGPWVWRDQVWLPPPLVLAMMYGYQVIIGPLFEECAFRGGLQGSLAHYIGPGGAAVLVGILFVCAHGLSGSVVNELPIFLGAAALGFLRWKTDSVWICFFLHAAGNAFQISVPLFLAKT